MNKSDPKYSLFFIEKNFFKDYFLYKCSKNCSMVYLYWVKNRIIFWSAFLDAFPCYEVEENIAFRIVSMSIPGFSIWIICRISSICFLSKWFFSNWNDSNAAALCSTLWAGRVKFLVIVNHFGISVSCIFF